MKKSRYINLIVLLFFLLLTTTNQPISSSPDILDGLPEIPPPSPVKAEIAEMQGLFEDYEQWLTEQIVKSKTVGAAVAITYKDQIAFLRCFGTTRVNSNDSVNEHTIFRLASVSKPVTSVLTGILAQENIIDFDEKVCEIIPWLKLSNQSHASHLSLRNLLSHTTGLAPHAYDDLVEVHLPMATIIHRLKNAGLSAAPGKVYGYQNVMFSLVDTIMAVKTSMNFSQLIREKLFIPLGMEDASTDFISFKNNPNKAYPHREGNGYYRQLPLNDRYYTTAPAAGVNASITDMARFMLGLLNENNPILNDEIFHKIFEPQIVSPLSSGYFRYWDQIKNKNYALGWRMVDYKDRSIAYHGGYVNGYKAEIAISKQDNIGIVYLTNSPNPVASQSIPVFLNSFFEFRDNLPKWADSEMLDDDDSDVQGI